MSTPPTPACHSCEARRTIALLKVWAWTSLFVRPASPSMSVLPLKVKPPLVEGVRLKASEVTARLPLSVTECCGLARPSKSTEAQVITDPPLSTSLNTAPFEASVQLPLLAALHVPEVVAVQRAVVGVTTEGR